jgi:amino acid adenylation domain-containing protein
VGPDDAACLTFTSGSTGRPKGVLGLHGSLSHFHPWLGRRFGFGKRDRFGLLSALAHDPLQRDVFTPLWFGASLHVPDPERIGAPGYMADWVRREGITILNLTPAMAELLARAAEETRATLPSLRLAFVVGDLFKRSELERLQRWAPALACVNLYGATETQRALSFFEVQPGGTGLRPGREALPLGRGYEGVQLLVLNAAGQLAGIGELGEIHVCSRHLARGYLGDNALTASRFLPDPFSANGDRIYRTGDLGRFLPDGNVEFAGREDGQVKIRGFRIELGEVEAALRRFPGIRACVVAAREDGSHGRRLAAYLVTDLAQAPVRELRAFLASLLPEFMIPSSFMILPEIPLNPAGKVDRGALPAPEAQAAAATDLAGPRTAAEEIVAAIWTELLGVRQVGVHEDFFGLGGHSLLATRLIARVRNATGIELPLRTVFESPTVEAIAATVEQRLREGGIPPAPPILPLARGRELPLSFAQQRLWFLDQLETGSPAYNLSIAVRLSGQLDLRALRGAVTEIVRRHEILRTTFVAGEGSDPVQVIAPPAPPALSVVDLETLPETNRDREMHLLAAGYAQLPFDLVLGPLLRMVVLRLGPREHALVVGIHHIVSDGWSLGVFLRELAAIYTACVAESLPALTELPIQYADFAGWQRNWLRGEVLEAQLRFWTRQLTGAPPVLELPLDRPRPRVQTHRGGRVLVEISQALSERLEIEGRRCGATPFMTLFAAFSVLLCRYAGQEEVVVGVPVANRSRTELEGSIGPYANTLALRADLKRDPTFAELVLRIRDMALGAYAHQDLPFEKLIAELQPDRDLGRSPLFQVMFTLQNTPRLELKLPNLALSALALKAGRAPFDLTLSVAPQAEGLSVRLELNLDLFDESTAMRLASHYRNLLFAIVEEPGERVFELPLLTIAERCELFALGYGTAAETPPLLVHELFERQAERTPDAVAIIFEGASLSYGELNRRANRLAHHLRRLGVGTEARVGLCVRRSFDLLVGLLGVLKAGGAYVPLDPAYPPSRLALVIEDAGIELVLTESITRASLPAYDARTVELDGGGFATESQENPEPRTAPEGLAYAIYTSGSTGRPKGVEIQHRSVVNFLGSMARRPGLSHRDVLVAITTISFDIAVLELFLPLAVGARIELASRETAADGELLAALIEASRATVVQATPSTWRMLLDSGWQGDRRLTALCGGEALPRGLAERLRAHVGALWNVYGPTETTVWSAAHQVREERWFVPIGGPLANTEIHVVDRHLMPVPLGVAGELVIGGEGLARGYLGQPDLTAERFIPNPFGGFGGRLYRAGDLVRRRSNGEIEFLGRLDHQVKVRGFRIEAAEVEGALLGHPAVREAVVTVREDRRGDRILAAYVVADEEAACAPAELRGFLRELLPEHMIPTAFVSLPMLPRTPNGKVDRKALPAPGEARAGAVDYVPPRTETERLIASVWREVLGVEKVGLRHNFFDLGGHSLLLVRILGRLRTALQRSDLTLVQLFNYPDVDSLARFLTDQKDETAAIREARGRARQQLEGRSRRRQALAKIKEIS